MCFGVRDAIAMAMDQSRHQPLTILGDLVHNETVLGELKAKGIRIVQNAAAVETQSVMITAHGASERAMQSARGRGAGASFGAAKEGQFGASDEA